MVMLEGLQFSYSLLVAWVIFLDFFGLSCGSDNWFLFIILFLLSSQYFSILLKGKVPTTEKFVLHFRVKFYVEDIALLR